MAIDRNIKLPQKFREQYQRNIAIRLGGSAGILGAAALLCTVVDFSGSRYPAMSVIIVIGLGFLLACILFRLNRILFTSNWSGTITDIDVTHKYKTNSNPRALPVLLLIVTLTIDCGRKKPKIIELRPDSDLHGSESENKFYTEAPYKVGDTVVFLRGMKYPMRYGVETEDMFGISFVCPYCGDINEAERDTCYKCSKYLVK